LHFQFDRAVPSRQTACKRKPTDNNAEQLLSRPYARYAWPPVLAAAQVHRLVSAEPLSGASPPPLPCPLLLQCYVADGESLAAEHPDSLACDSVHGAGADMDGNVPSLSKGLPDAAAAADALPQPPPEVLDRVAGFARACCDNSHGAWVRLSMVSRDWRQALQGDSSMCWMIARSSQ